MSSEADLIFGKLAIKKGYLDETQLVEVIRVQQDLKEVGIEKSLGEILSERGIMSPDKVETILNAQKYTQIGEEDRLYGELAVRNGFCTVADVREALAEQQAAIAKKAAIVPRLGNILRERGKIFDQQHEAIKKAQARLGKPLDLLESSIPSKGAQAKKPVAAGAALKCSVCGELVKAGADRCAICGTPLPGRGKAADVAAAEMMRSSAEDERNLFGSVAVMLGFVSEAQVDECLTVQRGLAAKGMAKKLGEIMVTKSYISPMQIEKIVNEQLSARGELMLDVGQEKKRARPILALDQNVAEVAGRPGAGGGRASSPARAARQAPAAPAPVQLFRLKNQLMSYAMIGGGLLLLIAVGYGIFKLVSGKSPTVKDSTVTKVDPAEEARKAERALKEAEESEVSGTGTADIRALISKYSEVADRYPNATAGKKACARKGELTAALGTAQEEFLKAQSAASAACSVNDYDKAVGILEAFVARVSAMTGKPLLQEGKGYFESLVLSAKADFQSRLEAVRRALSEGKTDAAIKDTELLRVYKVLSYCDECRKSFGKLDADVKTAKAKLDQERETAAQAARHVEEWRKQAPTLAADARQLLNEAKFGEAILGFRKAMLFSSGGQVANDAAKGLGEAQAVLKKTQADLLSALNFVRNWTVAKKYAKAADKCAEVTGVPSFIAFHEDFQNIAKELKKLEKSKGDHAPMLKKYDELQKAINDWATDQLALDPALRCSSCDGAGEKACDECAGLGKTGGANCAACLGSGKAQCTVCAGTVKRPCSTCKATGVVDGWEEKVEVCPKCGGTGINDKYIEKKPCPVCKGKGRVKQRVRVDNVPCNACNGNGQTVCDKCTQGTMKCPQCNGTSKIPVMCTKCAGKGIVPCDRCNRSGLAPEKF